MLINTKQMLSVLQYGLIANHRYQGHTPHPVTKQSFLEHLKSAAVSSVVKDKFHFFTCNVNSISSQFHHFLHLKLVD